MVVTMTAGLAAAAFAQAAVHAEAVHVHPSVGQPATTFTVTFRSPDRTGAIGSLERRDVVSASTPSSRRGCVATFGLRAPDARAGSVVALVLSPARVGGDFCRGRFRGEVAEEETPACKPGHACPQFIVMLGVLGRFSFDVQAPAPPASDTAPPAFAGLVSATACTPGPQRPGETTPFTLSWLPAHDNRTPSSSIVYEVYLAAMPGGEDFAMPTWTTPPGATTFRTPGLASHGSFYFVVRARDQAGNEDRNTVERHGVDPCL